jgi:hypothetical protein
VPDLNLGHDTDSPEVFHGFPQTLEANARKAPLNIMATSSPILSSLLGALLEPYNLTLSNRCSLYIVIKQPTIHPYSICSLRMRSAMVTRDPLKKKLRVSENWVLRSLFGPKREELHGRWIKYHNDNFDNLYSAVSVIMAGIAQSV